MNNMLYKISRHASIVDFVVIYRLSIAIQREKKEESESEIKKITLCKD